jgi:glycyl-tRNA synthetase (class II)
MEKPNKELFDKIVKIAQNRGFVFNASSIYGGLRRIILQIFGGSL